ncbi:ribonuclease R [bacterium]|nr:ribonuclease R [bacterium]
MSNTIDFEKEIISFLKKNKHKSYKINELQRLLKIPQNEYENFRIYLAELYKTDKVTRYEGKRYAFKQVKTTFKGRVEVTPRGYGFAFLEESGEKIYVAANDLKTALNGDLVEIELFAETTTKGKNREGKILKILETKVHTLVGTYQKSRKFNFVIPDDNRIRRDVYIDVEESLPAHQDDKVVVELYGWEHEKINPTGKIIEVLGKTGEPGVDILSVARSFEISEKFPTEVEREAKNLPATISNKEIDKRMDLRDLVCFTIDPFDAKDFDDAVSVEVLENGNFLVGVHIADVSHYVTEDSLLDKEAFLRGTSTYLVDRVIPMLPEELSNELCSLKPKVDRLTYSCFVELNENVAIKNYKIGKSVIHSKRRFTYQEVQEIINTNEGDFAKEIALMQKIAKKLTKKRMEAGSIDFATTEVKFKLDAKGNPVEVFKVERLDSHRLVEEFMLLANKIVAQHISKEKKKDLFPFLYRIHEKPSPEKVQDLQEFIGALGYEVNKPKIMTPKEFAKLISVVKGSSEEFVINEIAIRSMMKAVYSENNVGHFGLAFKDYTHFTSPIRRYPDLIVHRLLYEYEKRTEINPKRTEFLQKRLPVIAKQSSEMERNATDAERKSVAIKKVEFIEKYIGEEFDAMITGVTEFGIFCQIEQFGVEGLVHIRELNDDYYKFDEKHYRLIGERTDKTYRLGDKLKIKVKGVDSYDSKVDFVIVYDEEQENFVTKKTRRKKR